MRTTTETFQVNLDFTHIDRDLIDIPCNVELELYRGSGDIDDPSEIDILSIKTAEPVNIGMVLLNEGFPFELTKDLEKDILNKYSRHQNSY